MEIQENTVVTLSYHVRKNTENGELIDFSGQAYPLRFLFGNGKMLPYFEEQLKRKSQKETFAFRLPADFAYGKKDKSLIKSIPIEEFKENEDYTNETLAVGAYIRYENSQKSQSRKIIDIYRKEVIVDFNHPLAGQDLYFKGNIIAVRRASFEEIQRQHHMEPDGIRFK